MIAYIAESEASNPNYNDILIGQYGQLVNPLSSSINFHMIDACSITLYNPALKWWNATAACMTKVRDYHTHQLNLFHAIYYFYN